MRSLPERLLDHLPVGVVVVEVPSDHPGEARFVYANEASETHSGIAVTELVGRTITEAMPASLDGEAVFPRAFLRVAETGEPRQFEAPYADPDHPAGQFAVDLVPLGDRLVMSVYRNITAERPAFAAQDLPYRSIVEHLPYGLVVYRAEGDDPRDLRLVFANAGTARHGGYDMRAVVGQRLEDAFPNSLTSVPEVPQAFIRAARDGAEASHDVPYGDDRVTSGWFHQQVVPLGNDLMMAVFHDITARKQLEQELRDVADELDARVAERTTALERVNGRLAAANEHLDRLNNDLEQFAAVAAHELRSPLRRIRSFADVIEEAVSQHGDHDAGRALGFIRDEAERLGRLVESLLAFARTGVPQDWGVADLDSIVREVADDREDELAEAGAKVRVAGLEPIAGDALQLRLVFSNLIDNALKYRSEDPLRIEIEGRREDGALRIIIRDNGIGIAPRDHERAFELMRQLHPPGHYAGVGVGLALCQRIVEQHGGTMTLDPESGNGATFVIVLPVTRDQGNGHAGNP